MTPEERQNILDKYKVWFRESLVISHKANTEKLTDINEFNINPLLLYYLANYLEGNASPKSLAKALVYPRVLGTSINTSFGQQIQSFITKVLDIYGSAIPGIDIEFIDQVDNRKKYCQLKSGPNAINHDDVVTIKGHFTEILNRARKNELRVEIGDLIFCLIYGLPEEKNSFVKKLEKDYIVFIGKEFWHRFTGDEGFYRSLIEASGEVANSIDMKEIVEKVIEELSSKIETRFRNLG